MRRNGSAALRGDTVKLVTVIRDFFSYRKHTAATAQPSRPTTHGRRKTDIRLEQTG